MGALIDSVGQYTRLDAPERSDHAPCSLADVIADVRENLARIIAERDATIVHGDLPSMKADPVHLRQLFQNLIANAILHNASGVTVTVRQAMVNGQRSFVVSDDGVGVALDQREQIFQPFRRLVHRNDASGLGLAICRRIVALYGGEFACRSSSDAEAGRGAGRGAGAAFHFSLPDAEPLGQAAILGRADAVTDDGAPAKDDEVATVLIVDDREADLELTEMALFRRPRLRCKLRSVRDGREAQRILSEPGNDIDLILLDINMPDIDGFSLLDQIRHDDALEELTVIMCSGSDHKPDQRRSAELGTAGYLLKPPRFASFRDIVADQPGLRLQDDGTGLTLVQRRLNTQLRQFTWRRGHCAIAPVRQGSA